MVIENMIERIKAWREAEPGSETETYTDLICDAEEVLDEARAKMQSLFLLTGALADLADEAMPNDLDEASDWAMRVETLRAQAIAVNEP